MVDVMHHLPLSLRKDYFSDVLGRVRPGGRLVYKDMCMKPSWRRQVNILHDLVMAREWVHNEPLERVVGWAREQRCRVVHQDSYTGLGVYGHELAVFEKGQGAAVE